MKVAVVVGTRPEAIKMAPVMRALIAETSMKARLWSSGQHREMLDQALALFGLAADRDLGVMTADQGLSAAFAAVLEGTARLIAEDRPDWLLVHGDTSTAAAAALAGFHAGVRVGHVEAGLRSGRMDQPWPEEFNRRLADMVSSLHFAPTEGARANLLKEGVSDATILVTGNTVIDALLETRRRLEADPARTKALDAAAPALDPNLPLVLVTGHRRENFGEGFQQICEAMVRLDETEAVQVIYPVHLNPNVQAPVKALLSNRSRVHLMPPVDYEAFVRLMMRAQVILTDSGGVQEEAPSLGKPVLVMREVTERPEAVEAGAARLVGSSPDAIVGGVMAALDAGWPRIERNPYGDGQAARRIVEGLTTCP